MFCIQDGQPRFSPDYKDPTPKQVLKKINADQAKLQDHMFKPLFDVLEAWISYESI